MGGLPFGLTQRQVDEEVLPHREIEELEEQAELRMGQVRAALGGGLVQRQPAATPTAPPEPAASTPTLRIHGKRHD